MQNWNSIIYCLWLCTYKVNISKTGTLTGILNEKGNKETRELRLNFISQEKHSRKQTVENIISYRGWKMGRGSWVVFKEDTVKQSTIKADMTMKWKCCSMSIEEERLFSQRFWGKREKRKWCLSLVSKFSKCCTLSPNIKNSFSILVFSWSYCTWILHVFHRLLCVCLGIWKKLW